MPIRDENKARYPKDWKAISLRIRERAGNECEKCKAVNGELICREQSEDYHFEPTYADETGQVFSAEDGRHMGFRSVQDIECKWVRVVLTVAHLDHQPENCADENLRAWCQRCHNIYDMPMRKAGIASRARQQYAAADLFAPPPTPQETP